MKVKTLILLGAALALAGSCTSCKALAGTNIGIGENGVTVTPPPTPIVIPTSGK